MSELKSHTPGPYGMRPAPGGHDAEIFSEATGESLALVRSGNSHGDAPNDETAMRNAELFRAAPDLHRSLQKIVAEERLRPETASSARGLLALVATGPDASFERAREEELREFEEVIDAQFRDMSSDDQRGGWLDIKEEDEESFGHSF